MKIIRVFFLSENFQFLEVKFSIYLNRRVFVMIHKMLNQSEYSGEQTRSPKKRVQSGVLGN